MVTLIKWSEGIYLLQVLQSESEGLYLQKVNTEGNNSIFLRRSFFSFGFEAMSYTTVRRYHLTSIELWSACFDLETYTVITHQQISLLLAKSTLSCWMYPKAQIVLSPTPSHSWVPPEYPTISKLSADPGSLLFTVKQASRPKLSLKTQPPTCLDYRACNRPSTVIGYYGKKQSFWLFVADASDKVETGKNDVT